MAKAVLAALLPRASSSGPLRYVLALIIVGVATGVRLAVDPLLHDQIPYFVYVAGVVVASWFCGFGGGILATVTSAFAANYFFVPPRHDLIPHGQDWLAMSLFAPVCLFMVWLVGKWRQAESELRQQRDELRGMHAEAERMSRLKDEFLATLSHELRTPLNAVLGWSHLLADPRVTPDKRQHAVDVIVRNAQAQTRLIDDVLDISRIVNGKMQLHLAAVDMADVVLSAVQTVRPAADAKQIELTHALAAHAILAGDRDRLQQVVWNLLSNAVKFTPKGGRVHIRTSVHESQFVLTVTDTGIGIEGDFLPHLFQRFRQADSSTTRVHGGLGVGLAIVRHLVELHGGVVVAESPGRDRGATFTIRLPIRALLEHNEEGVRRAGEGKAPVDVAVAPRLDGLRLLVVDDEPDARHLVQSALSHLGAEVITAASAADAFEMVRRWQPDVLVADISMPVEDGYSLIRRIRALPPTAGGKTPAIALTAYAQEEDRARAHAAGYQAHVAKPVPPNTLARIVASSARPN